MRNSYNYYFVRRYHRLIRLIAIPLSIFVFTFVSFTFIRHFYVENIEDSQTALSPSTPKKQELAPFKLEERPDRQVKLFDYSNLLPDMSELVESTLLNLYNNYNLEVLFVTLKSLPSNSTNDTLANNIFNNWKIGAQNQGRGILVLLLDDSKTVRVEVGYQLEGIFTDAFVGYVQDLQLGTYYRNDDLPTGMLALLEELGKRTRRTYQKEYNPVLIENFDKLWLSGGAGAKREMPIYGKAKAFNSSFSGAGAETPAIAWEALLKIMEFGVEGTEVDPLSESSKLEGVGEWKNDPRIQRNLPTWKSLGYQVLSDGKYAAIYFGKKEGWVYNPFLFFKGKDGWKYDLTHQRFAVPHIKPSWAITRSGHPYVKLFKDKTEWWMYTGDWPIQEEDIYTPERDLLWGARIRYLEETYKKDPSNFLVVSELGRLNSITCRFPGQVLPILSRAKELEPEEPDPYKYLALYNVRMMGQNKTALNNMLKYVELKPSDVYGYKFLGYVYTSMKEYAKAISALKIANKLEPNTCSTLVKLSEAYAGLYDTSNILLRSEFKAKSREYYTQAYYLGDGCYDSISNLHHYVLKKKGVY